MGTAGLMMVPYTCCLFIAYAARTLFHNSSYGEFNLHNQRNERDPVKVIREAISKALVFYYPLAGRLKEGYNRKLMVECNAKGVLFIEADANFTLEQLGDDIQPPCPYLNQLLYDVPGSEGILGCPSLLIQSCRGFIFAIRFNHTIHGGHGTWGTFPDCISNLATTNLKCQKSPTISCIVNVRGKRYKMDIPPGYYGNAFTFSAVCSTAEQLCKNPIGYAVELVKKAKAQMNEEYIRSVADLMVIKGRRIKSSTRGNFIVSDLRNVGLGDVDFGWGKPIYGGAAGAVAVFSFCVKYQSKNGEPGILVPICLPQSAMERFQEELKRLMIQGSMEDLWNTNQTQVFSKL
ncbi:hypothetical protein CUMW_165410 [Citrus unshiu]|nr:hypothetical protein CUMW_165410 [Citrus unshiu]